MATVTISLVGEPRGKGRGRVGLVGRPGSQRPTVFTPAATRKYEAAFREAASREMEGRVPFEGPVEVVVLAQFLVPQSWSQRKREAAHRGEILPTKKPDADNLLKLLDSCNTVVWRDDSQIVTATVRKVYAPQAALIVRAREITPAQPPLLSRVSTDADEARGQGRPAL